jgi:hypothetical protein
MLQSCRLPDGWADLRVTPPATPGVGIPHSIIRKIVVVPFLPAEIKPPMLPMLFAPDTILFLALLLGMEKYRRGVL